MPRPGLYSGDNKWTVCNSCPKEVSTLVKLAQMSVLPVKSQGLVQRHAAEGSSVSQIFLGHWQLGGTLPGRQITNGWGPLISPGWGLWADRIKPFQCWQFSVLSTQELAYRLADQSLMTLNPEGQEAVTVGSRSKRLSGHLDGRLITMGFNHQGPQHLPAIVNSWLLAALSGYSR